MLYGCCYNKKRKPTTWSVTHCLHTYQERDNSTRSKHELQNNIDFQKNMREGVSRMTSAPNKDSQGHCSSWLDRHDPFCHVAKADGHQALINLVTGEIFLSVWTKVDSGMQYYDRLWYHLVLVIHLSPNAWCHRVTRIVGLRECGLGIFFTWQIPYTVLESNDGKKEQLMMWG